MSVSEASCQNSLDRDDTGQLQRGNESCSNGNRTIGWYLMKVRNPLPIWHVCTAMTVYRTSFETALRLNNYVGPSGTHPPTPLPLSLSE
jgi:hypothetical protein